MAKRYKPKIRQVFREIPLKYVRVWKEAQARTLDRPRVREIARSIKSEGLQNPPLVQKGAKNEYLLISGHHRFSALKLLGAKKAKFLVLTRDTSYDLEDAKAASVAENIHREKMSSRDVAAACTFLAEQVGRREAARKLGMSMLTFRRYHGFAGVPEKLKDLVPRAMSRDEATRLHQIVPNTTKALRVAERLSGMDSPARKLYLRVLGTSPNSPHGTIMKRMRRIGVKRKVTVELSKTKAGKLARAAEKRDVEPARLANQIISQWLDKRR